MPVVVELVHAEPGRRVVLARQLEGGTTLATALGEGASAEEAEDRARARLQAHTVATAQERAAEPPLMVQSEQTLEQQIELQTNQQAEQKPGQNAEQQAEQTSEKPIEPPGLAQREPDAPQEPPADPEDWSSELASLDLQLKRLGWSREQEAVYLLRAFGHGSRSRLTTYGDLVAYLRALESFAPGADPASCSIPLKRSDLLSQSDQLLAQLGWDAVRGRQLLEGHFGRNSRQQLSDAQLLEFNMLLESEVLALT